MSLNPDSICRTKLRGKVATNRDFALEVAKLTVGNINQNIPPLIEKRIALTLGFKNIASIQKLKALAKELNFFKELNQPKQTRSDYIVSQDLKDFVAQHEEVKAWVKLMNRRAKGGKPFGGTWKMVRKFRNVCETLKMNPVQWITGSSRQEILDHSEECMNNYVDMYFKKEAKIQYKKNWVASDHTRLQVSYNHAEGVNDFMRTNGFAFQEGMGGVMSRSITAFHGNYSDTKFKDWKQYQDMKNYLADKFSLESDIFRWFSVGVEALPRAGAIKSMKNNFEEFTANKNHYYIMKVFESKTSQYKKGIWEKYIRDKDTKESINFAAKKSDFVIIDRNIQFPNKIIYPELRKLYEEFNIKTKERVSGKPETQYHITHTSHVLRHCGAQLWLKLTNWDIAFVASMGWKKSDELIDSYGEMPAEMKFEKLGSYQ